jgi:hypothetical protein
MFMYIYVFIFIHTNICVYDFFNDGSEFTMERTETLIGVYICIYDNVCMYVCIFLPTCT